MIIIIVMVLIFLFFVPFPLYLKFFFKDNKLSIFIYNFKVYPTKDINETLKEPKKRTLYPKVMYINILQNMYNKSAHFLFKSAMKIDFSITYGLNDAYTTAISYGLLQGFINSGFYFFNKTFRILSYKPVINLKYNEYFLEFTVNSIIYINLVKIIYITIFIYVSFKKGAKENLKPEEVV